MNTETESREAIDSNDFYTCKKLAEEGAADCMNHVGDCYYDGRAESQGCERSPEKAYYWYKKSAENGYIWGYYNVGKCYRYGVGVEKNWITAREWYKKAADMGNAWAKIEYISTKLGDFIDYVRKDLPDIDWRKIAYPEDYTEDIPCTDDDTEYLGPRYDIDIENGHLFYHESSIFYLSSLSIADEDCDLLNEIGDFYYDGRAKEQGIEKCPEEAFLWYFCAAYCGSVWGTFNVAKCFQNGCGIWKNEYRAYEWYRTAAVHGNCWAVVKLNEMGDTFFTKERIKNTPRCAFRWYKFNVIERKDPEYLDKLATCYEEGIGVARNYSTAEKLREYYDKRYIFTYDVTMPSDDGCSYFSEILEAKKSASEMRCNAWNSLTQLLTESSDADEDTKFREEVESALRVFRRKVYGWKKSFFSKIVDWFK